MNLNGNRGLPQVIKKFGAPGLIRTGDLLLRRRQSTENQQHTNVPPDVTTYYFQWLTPLS
jgi:hypothetical protein